MHSEQFATELQDAPRASRLCCLQEQQEHLEPGEMVQVRNQISFSFILT